MLDPLGLGAHPAPGAFREPSGAVTMQSKGRRRDDRMSAMVSLYRRWQQLVHELTKFGLVGVFNTVLDFGLTNALHVGLHANPYLAKTVAVIIAATSSYFMNRYWTFRHRARTGLAREYVLFFVLNGIGLLFRFTTYKRWVFLAPEHGVPAPVTGGDRQPAWSRIRA